MYLQKMMMLKDYDEDLMACHVEPALKIERIGN